MKDRYKYFKIEATELLEETTKSLLKLEKRPEDTELINTLFRYMHTLKGAASVVKLPKISQVVHKIEDWFALLRDKKENVSNELITILLKALNVVNDMLDAIKRGDSEDSVDISYILDLLQGKIKLSDNVADQSLPESIIVPDQGAMDDNKDPIKDNKDNAPVSKKYKQEEETIRVKLNDLDNLTDFVNEILINYNRLKSVVEWLRRLSKQCKESCRLKDLKLVDMINRSQACTSEIESAVDILERGLDRASQFSYEMSNMIMASRLISISSKVYYFERIVRDLSVELGKNVELIIQGKDLLIDRFLFEEIKEPIYHLLRNSIIHGLDSPIQRFEQGKPDTGIITLKFSKTEDIFKITCIDDGKGLDHEKLKQIALKKKLVDPKQLSEMSKQDAFNLIFLPGFSSKEVVTELAGRGVGLDVIKKSVLKLGGALTVKSEKDKFTSFIITVSAKLNIIETFMVQVGDHNLLLPLKYVLGTKIIKEDGIMTEAGRKVVLHNNIPVTLISLSGLLGPGTYNFNKEKINVIIVQEGSKIAALMVNEFKGKKDIVIKQLEDPLKKIQHISAATILENGDPAFVLDVVGIFEYIKSITTITEEKSAAKDPLAILVVDDSLSTRTLIGGVLESEGYKVQLAKCGMDALEALKLNLFKLIIVDIEMPGMNGFELSQEIRKQAKYSETPIIILSSLSSDDNKRRGIEVGANAYVVKGEFDQESFLETVERLLDLN